MINFKFGIKTRVFLAFGFFVILFINIAFIILYSFIETSFIKNINQNLKKEYTEIVKEIKKSKKENILNLSKKTIKKLEKSEIFVYIGKDNEELKKKYKNGIFIYDGNLIFRGDFEENTIILGKDVSNFENFRENIKENMIFINIFAIFIVFIMSYFLTTRILGPLIKLSSYVGKYDIGKNSKPIKNNYGTSELGIIVEAINKLISNSKKILENQKKFIQDSSHELKTPLMQIATNIDILEEKVEDTKCAKKIENIKKSIENMNNIISDLSFVLREEDKILKKEDINICEYLKSLVKSYEEEASKKKIKIVFKQRGKCFLKSNKYYLDRLFGNLISNSIFYNKGNGIIKIELQKNKIILTDSGIGIQEKELEKIFSRFYRNDKSNIYNKNGSGLGLTIVKKICDDFNWKIKVESKVGVGTKFEISF